MKSIRSKISQTLMWSQKLTKLDVRYLARSGFWLGLQQVLVTIFAFGLSVLMANFVSKADFGTYKFVLSILNIFILTTLPGVSISVTRTIAKNPSRDISQMTRKRIIWGLLGSVASLGMGLYYFFSGNPTLSLLFLIVAVFIALFEAFTLYESWLRGLEKFKEVSLYKVGIQGVFTVLYGLYIYLAQPGVISIIFWYLFGYTLLRFVFYVKTFGFSAVLDVFNKRDLSEEEKETLHYGKNLSVMNVITVISLAVDKVIVFHYLGAASLAVYAFALSLPDQLKATLKQLVSVALPRLSDRTYEEVKKTTPVRLLVLLFGVSIITFGYIAIAPWLYQLVFPLYVESVVYSQIIALALIPNAGMFYVRTIFNAQMKVKKQYIFSTIYPILQTTLLIFGFFWSGLFGLSIGYSVAQVLGLFFSLILLYGRERA